MKKKSNTNDRIKNILIFIIIIFSFLFGCKKEIPVYKDFYYPDGFLLFKNVWKANLNSYTQKHTIVNNVNSNEFDINRLRKMINVADFSDINSEVANGNIETAIAKLKLLKQKYIDNPFVSMQCDFYIAELYKTKQDPIWRTHLDSMLNTYNKIQNDEEIKNLMQKQKDNDIFLQKYLLKTSETTIKK